MASEAKIGLPYGSPTHSHGCVGEQRPSPSTIGMCRRTIVKYKPPTIKAKLLCWPPEAILLPLMNLLRGRGQMGAKCGPWRPKQGFDLSCGGFVGLHYDPPTHSNGQN